MKLIGAVQSPSPDFNFAFYSWAPQLTMKKKIDRGCSGRLQGDLPPPNFNAEPPSPDFNFALCFWAPPQLIVKNKIDRGYSGRLATKPIFQEQPTPHLNLNLVTGFLLHVNQL